MKQELKELYNLQLVDIAEGVATTGFIFKNSVGELVGFKIPTDKIEFCDFTISKN